MAAGCVNSTLGCFSYERTEDTGSQFKCTSTQTTIVRRTQHGRSKYGAVQQITCCWHISEDASTPKVPPSEDQHDKTNLSWKKKPMLNICTSSAGHSRLVELHSTAWKTVFADSLVCVLTYWPMKFMGTAQLPKNVFKIQSITLVSDITRWVKHHHEGKSMHAAWFGVSINCVTCQRHVLSPAGVAVLLCTPQEHPSQHTAATCSFGCPCLE